MDGEIDEKNLSLLDDEESDGSEKSRTATKSTI